MRNGWTICQLGDVIVSGRTIDPTKTPTRKFKYVDVSGVSNRTFRIEQTSEILGSDAPSRARRQIKSGDIIFATIRPTLKRIAVVPPELDGEVCSTAFFVFRTRPNLDPKFLFYYLFTDIFMGGMESLQTGASYPAVNDTQVREQKIAFPALPEQKRIVAILDEAFEGIETAVAKAEKNLANARELFESCLNNAVSKEYNKWNARSIGDLCIIGDGNHSSKYPKSSEMVSEGVPFIRSTNIVNGKLSWDNIIYISEKKHEELKKGHLKTGDVLFTNRGEIGKVAIVDETFNGANLNSQIAWLRCREEIISGYLFFFLQSGNMRAHFQQTKSGTALQQFTIRMLKDVPISFPKIDVQWYLVGRLSTVADKIDDLKIIYERKLETLEELKQALLKRAFAGKLIVSSAEAIHEAAE